MEKLITVRVTQDQHRDIKMLAAETGLTIKDIFWLGVERARENKEEGKMNISVETLGELMRDNSEVEEAVVQGHLNRPGWSDDLYKLKEMAICFLQPACSMEELREAISKYQDDVEELGS